MANVRSVLSKVGGEMLAISMGSLAGVVVGAIAGFILFLMVELLAEVVFGFEGFGEGPFVDMAPRSRFRGGFLVLGAIVGIPVSWWWMRRMEKADETATGD